MARVAVLSPDLLFGSKVQGMLRAAGHDVDLLGAELPASGYDLLVVDLMADGIDAAALAATGLPTLGFFNHTETAVRERALADGFDMVVPRSRMNREGAELVAGLLSRR